MWTRKSWKHWLNSIKVCSCRWASAWIRTLWGMAAKWRRRRGQNRKCVGRTLLSAPLTWTFVLSCAHELAHSGTARIPNLKIHFKIDFKSGGQQCPPHTVTTIRGQFETYLDKVFDFPSRVAGLPDGRSYSYHSAKKVFDAVFFASACQFGPVHRIETECKMGALRRRIGPLSEDAIGYTLERQDPDAIFALGCTLAQQLKRNQVLHSTWSRGLVVAAADGIEICSSFARCCSRCMERT